MKKVLLSMALALFIFVGCNESNETVEVDEVEEVEVEETNTDDNTFGYDIPEDNKLEKITMPELEQKIESGEKVYVLFGRVT